MQYSSNKQTQRLNSTWLVALCHKVHQGKGTRCLNQLAVKLPGRQAMQGEVIYQGACSPVMCFNLFALYPVYSW